MFTLLKLKLLAFGAIWDWLRPKKKMTAYEIERQRIRSRNALILWTLIIICAFGILVWSLVTGF